MTANPAPYVAGLFIYPIKSLDPVAADTVTVLPSGALKGDRQFAMVDASGNFVNGKRNKRVHALRSHVDLDTTTVIISVQGHESSAQFHMNENRQAFEAWLSDYFGFPVDIRQNVDTGFPDDTDSPGPTIISTATLEEIASWYPNLDVEDVRLRFRANIEIAGVPAFWEDQLVSTADRTVDFQIGTVTVMGVNPCQRCVVITRDPLTGNAYPNFQKIFVSKRQETLPDWAERSRFNHFYRLSINTRLPVSEGGKTITLGDQVRIL